MPTKLLYLPTAHIVLPTIGNTANVVHSLLCVKNKMDIVAERNLVIDCGDRQIDASVKVGRPVPDESGENWMCPYEVWVQDDCKSFRMHGIDSMQALQLAIKTLDVELEVKAKELGGKIEWLGEPFVSVLERGFSS